MSRSDKALSRVRAILETNMSISITDTDKLAAGCRLLCQAVKELDEKLTTGNLDIPSDWSKIQINIVKPKTSFLARLFSVS